MRLWPWMITFLLIASCTSTHQRPPLPQPVASRAISDTSPSATPVFGAPTSVRTTTPAQNALPTSAATLSPTVAATSLPHETQISSDGWTLHHWAGMIIAVPPQGQWHPDIPIAAPNARASVQVAGEVVYPESIGAVEGLHGPRFVVLAFVGSLDDWIQAEQQQNIPGNPVDDQTIQQRLIAGVPGVAYQRAITGVGMIEYYAIKPTPETLLWIITDDTENTMYTQIIDRLAFDR